MAGLRGRVAIVLHAHLPYVLTHGTFPHGSDWVCEAVAESYLPLLGVLRRLLLRGIVPRWTIELSPVLCEQLASPRFRVLFQNYCRQKQGAARQDEEHFRRYGYDPLFVELARFWQSFYAERLREFTEEYRGKLLAVLERLQRVGAIELLASAATHAYLPLLPSERSVGLQLRLGVETYRRYFRMAPRGIWLPECGYCPADSIPARALFGAAAERSMGTEQWLARLGLEYCVLEEELLRRATPLTQLPLRTVLLPYRIASAPNSPSAVAFFRHRECAARVWDARIGYPGDGDYLDFHKKHHASFLRYWRVTDNRTDLQYKLLYVPQWAQSKARHHAEHFAGVVVETLLQFHAQTGYAGVLCLPFDMELFGHWWFEGPLFLEALTELLDAHPEIALAPLGECLEAVPVFGPVRPPDGSWGADAGHLPWADPQVHWIWQLLRDAEARLRPIVERLPEVRNPLLERIVRQALRELLLLQSSDWSFLIVGGTARDYAQQRVFFHAQDFHHLCEFAERVLDGAELAPEQQHLLEQIEQRDALFAELSPRWWSAVE
jgi:1,4-alpha-glucan branching enzyme